MNRLLVACLIVLAALAPTADALARSESLKYVLATGVVTNAEGSCEDGATAVNGACFALYPGERHVALKVEDASQRSVAVTYSFLRGDEILASGTFCGSSSFLAVPPSARTLVVVLGEPGKLDADLPGCQLQRGVGGVIHAVFR